MVRTKQTIILEIKDKLSAYPNSPIIREAFVLLDELRDLPNEGIAVTKKDVKRICFRGYTPNTEACVDCKSRTICNLI